MTLLPLSEELQWENAKLRALLLRRLRLLLDLDERLCRCGRTLDWLGDHRAACGEEYCRQERCRWNECGHELGEKRAPG